MGIKTNRSVQRIFDLWQTEDRELEVCVEGVRSWMQEVNQLGIPHFGEAATRLTRLRERLVQHFDREDDMIAQLAGSCSPQIDNVWTETLQEHSQLLDALDDLIERLNALEPPFASWTEAMDQVEALVCLLEQHESRESQAIKNLRGTLIHGDAAPD